VTWHCTGSAAGEGVGELLAMSCVGRVGEGMAFAVENPALLSVAVRDAVKEGVPVDVGVLVPVCVLVDVAVWAAVGVAVDVDVDVPVAV